MTDMTYINYILFIFLVFMLYSPTAFVFKTQKSCINHSTFDYYTEIRIRDIDCKKRISLNKAKASQASQEKMARRLVPIKGDGNCLFRSVSYCLFGTQEKHREIRLRVVERVVNNWHRYKDFIIGDRSYGLAIQGPSDYGHLMTRDGEYAGHVELHCISELYPDVAFVVHMDICSKVIQYGQGRVMKHLLFSGFLDAGHYSVLEYY